MFSNLSRRRPLLDGLVLALSLLGVLVVVHLWIQTGRGFDRGCFGFSEPTSTFNCEAVISSDAGKLLGVSNVVWGFGFYLAMTALSFLVLLGSEARVSVLKRLRALLIGGGFAYSVYLSMVQVFQIGEYCKLCLISAGTVALLFALLLADVFSGRGSDAAPEGRPKRASLYFGLAGLVVVLAGADLAYFSSLEDGPASPAATVAAAGAGASAEEGGAVGSCGYDPEFDVLRDYRAFISAGEPAVGNPVAGVQVVEFFDPNCPHCRTMHPVMARVIEGSADKALFVFRPLILWNHSVMQVEALHHAHSKGKFFEMLDKQFEYQKQSGLSPEEVESIAGEIGMDVSLLRTRLQAGLYRATALRQREEAMNLGIRSVPAVMINGRLVTGASRTVDCLTQLIEEAGA